MMSPLWGIGFKILLIAVGLALLAQMRGVFHRLIVIAVGIAILVVIVNSVAGTEAEAIKRIRAGGLTGVLCCVRNAL
jgi:hypothetical protein